MTKTIKSSLYSHQKENLQFHLKHDASADWSEPGVGKSLIALSKIAILTDLKLIKHVLIICPKTVMLTWDIEIKKHTNLTLTMLIGSLEEKIKRLKEKSNIFLITYDSIPGREATQGILLRELARKRFDFLIADEATLIKNRTAIRTRALTVLGDLIPRKLFLSGTPITNDPTSIFNIYRALDGGKTFGKNFFASRNKYFKNIGTYFPNWVMKDLMKEELSNRIYSIAVRQTKDECLDLPDKVWSSRYMEPSQEQRNYYIPIAEDILKDLDTKTGRVRIKTALDKIGKLSQILSGFLYTESGNSYLFNPNPKLELLESVIEEFPIEEKIIIYCKWKEEIRLLSKWCERKGYSYVALQGDTENRAELVDKFQNGNTKLFICNIAVGKYSLTLTSSSTIIYYSLGFGVEDFVQSSDRIHRISQSRTCLYIPLLTQNGIDEYIYGIVNRKLKIAQAITDPEFRRRLIKI